MKRNMTIHFVSKSERGQSLVELAISLIVLLTLLAGAVDFGIALYSYVSIRDAAQEGALYASIHPTEFDNILDRVRTSSDTPVDLSAFPDEDITITLIGAAACEGNGASIQIDVSYDYQLIMPILPEILGVPEIPLTATVTNAILQPPC